MGGAMILADPSTLGKHVPEGTKIVLKNYPESVLTQPVGCHFC